MKKSEKNAVKNAFGIPEPRHKDEFIAEYSSRLENRRRSPVPVFFKYAAAAAFAVIMISICIVKLPSPDKEFTGSDVIAEVTTSAAENEQTTLTEGSAVTTQPASDNSASSATETSAAVTDDTTSTVTTSEAVSSATTSGSAGTEKTVTTTKTTTASTDKTSTSQKTTTAKTTTTAATTTAAEDTTATQTATTTQSHMPETSVHTSSPPETDNGNKDYTVKPPVVYYPEDFSGQEEGTSGSDRPGAPVDGNDPVTQLPGSSSNTNVKGRVLRVYYTSINDQPFIQADIEISKVFRSWFLNDRDRITIYIPGGYISDGHGGYYRAMTYFIPDQGREYLFMLNSAYYPFHDNTFLLSEPIEMAVFIQDGSNYISAVDSSIVFSTQDVEKNIR